MSVRRQGHSALRVRNGKIETFDPHPSEGVGTMKLSEKIEALQSKWRERAGSELYFNVERVACDLCANELDPILAVARKQEDELAAMKEPKNVLIDAPQSKGICARCGKPVEVRMGQAWHTKSIDDGSAESVWHEVCSYQDAIEKVTKQHDADLREVAEMAIDVVTTGNKTFIHTNSRSIADSILAAFYEPRKKKPPVGCALCDWGRRYVSGRGCVCQDGEKKGVRK